MSRAVTYRRSVAVTSVALLICQTAVADELPGKVTYKLDQHKKSLEYIETDIKSARFKRAKESLTSLEESFANTVEWNKASAPVDHPAYLEFKAKLDKVKASIEVAEKASAEMSGKILPVVEAMNETSPPLENAVKEGRFALMGLSSMKSHYSQYRDPKKIADTLANLRDKVEIANGLVPAADNLTRHFKEQFPDDKAIAAVMPDKADEIQSSLVILTRHLDTWKQVKDQAVKSILADAKTDIEEAKGRLAVKKARDRQNAISHVQMWAINYHGPLLAAVDIIYPVSEKNADSVLALTDDQVQARKQAEKFRGEIAGLEKKIDKIQKARQAAHNKKIAAARWPSNAKPIPGNKTAVSKAVAAEFGKPLRLGAYSGWDTRKEARWIGNRWDVGVFKYLGVWVAAKTPSGKFRVYRISVRARKQGSGWGPIKHWSVGDSYEILKKNIKK